MNMNLTQEIIQTMRKVRMEGTNRQQKEAYLQIASNMNIMLQTMQDQQSQFARMANMAYEAGNSMLADEFQMMASQMNSELEAMEEMGLMARGIANS